MIRFGDHLGVRYDIKSHDNPFEIYDIVNDPKQLNDLSHNMPGLHQKMRDKVLRIRRPHPTAERPYDDEFIPALSEIVSQPGVTWKTWKTFENPESWLARLDDLDALESGVAANFNEIRATKGNAILVEGFIEVSRDGYCDFRIPGDSPGLLRIHEAIVIDIGGSAEMRPIKLKKGKHPFRYYRKGIGSPVELKFGILWHHPVVIPAEILSH